MRERNEQPSHGELRESAGGRAGRTWLRDLATVLLTVTALFEQGVAAFSALAPRVSPVAFSLAWLAEAAILWLLVAALDRGGERFRG